MSLALGIDIGGTKVALALADAEGRLVARHRRPTAATGRPREDVDRIARDARALCSEAGVAPEDLDAAGVSVPGPVDPVRDIVSRPPNLPGWDEVPVRRWLADELGTRVFIDNDANAAALAEWRFGAGRGADHMIYLTMSTGVGGGLVLGGRIHRGAGWNAGEVGHTPVEWGGERCACGMQGCLEAYVGGAAWTRRLRKTTPADSRVAILAGGVGAVTPEHLVSAAHEGDPFALGEMERFVDYLARGVTTLVFTLAPQVIVLGTICAAAGPKLCFEPLRERVIARVWPVFAEALEIVPGELGDTLADYAGVCVAREGLAAG